MPRQAAACWRAVKAARPGWRWRSKDFVAVGLLLVSVAAVAEGCTLTELNTVGIVMSEGSRGVPLVPPGSLTTNCMAAGEVQSPLSDHNTRSWQAGKRRWENFIESQPWGVRGSCWSFQAQHMHCAVDLTSFPFRSVSQKLVVVLKQT